MYKYTVQFYNFSYLSKAAALTTENCETSRGEYQPALHSFIES